MAQPVLWHREFTRNEGDDVDRLADADFLKSNFTDFFGKWLQKAENANVLSFDALLMEFWNGSQATPQRNTLSIFCAADGGDFPITPENSGWLSQSLRFVAFAASGRERPFDDNSPESWTLCMVGSSALDSKRAFLQVASWDGKVFRFYQRGQIENNAPSGGGARNGWIYQGVSTDAFTDEMSYLGPFNGHINGAIVMKELHKPWLHWHTDNHNLVGNLTTQDKDRFKRAPYLTDQGTGLIFSGLTSAESMELIIENGVNKWYSTRKIMDFFDSQRHLRSEPSNVRRWMAHLLLTTTVNIIVAQTIRQKWFAPVNHFYDQEMLSQYSKTDLLKDIAIPNFEFNRDDYKKASEILGLALIQDVERAPPGPPEFELPEGTLGGGKQTASFHQTLFVQVQEGENDNVMFTILQPSYEDAQGVLIMQNIKSNPGKPPTSLLSPKVFNSLMMVDFWNPVYSWRRGVLMQYVPNMTVYNQDAGKYNLEDQFITNVKESKFFKEQVQESPEYQFISLLDAELKDHQKRIQSYLQNVQTRLKTVNGLSDYLSLAESRRRIYRPLPLDEFALTLPYALKYGLDLNARYEMTESGEIQNMAGRGVQFFHAWTGTQEDGSLAGYDPQIIPRPDASTRDSAFITDAVSSSFKTQSVFSRKTRRSCPYRTVRPEKPGHI